MNMFCLPSILSISCKGDQRWSVDWQLSGSLSARSWVKPRPPRAPPLWFSSAHERISRLNRALLAKARDRRSSRRRWWCAVFQSFSRLLCLQPEDTGMVSQDGNGRRVGSGATISQPRPGNYSKWRRAGSSRLVSVCVVDTPNNTARPS